MPGAFLLPDEAIGRAVLIDHIMRADLRSGIAQPRQRFLGARHAGVMDHQHVDDPILGPGAGIGRGALDHGRGDI